MFEKVANCENLLFLLKTFIFLKVFLFILDKIYKNLQKNIKVGFDKLFQKKYNVFAFAMEGDFKMKKSKKLFLIVTLLVSLFTLTLTMKSSNNVNAKEISVALDVRDQVGDLLMVVQNSDGSEEETLINLTEILNQYGGSGKICVVSDDYSDESCTVIGTTDDLIERFGSLAKLIVTDGVKDLLFGTVGELSENPGTRRKIVITEEDFDDPYNVGICTIGELVSLS